MKKIGVVFIFVLISFSCKRSISLEKEIQDFQNTQIALMLNSMKYMGDKDVYSSIGEHDYIYVNYVDSFSCSDCAINHFSDWAHLERYRESGLLEYIFIVSPKKADVSRIVEKVNRDTLFRDQILIDSAGVFERVNKDLPKNKLLHTFLVDKGRKVKLVGSPIGNEKIERMLLKIIGNRQQ